MAHCSDREEHFGMFSRFASPQPTADDILFVTRPEFYTTLETIAEHISRPALDGVDSQSMTFAIYGKWGAGKSTALRLLKARIEEKMATSDRKPTFSSYNAPMWQGVRDVRAGLAFSVLKGIDPNSVGKVLSSLPPTDDGGRRRALLPAEKPLVEPVRLLAALHQFETAPPVLENWLGAISSQLSSVGREGNSRRVHVVFIDDLDRCEPHFTAQLLAAISMWESGEQVNVFFVLAASEEHLLDSLREHLPLGSRYPQHALEKYVHLSVRVPELLTTAEEVGHYLATLSERISIAGVDGQRMQELRELVSQSASTYPDCVLAPLLLIPEGGLTPREAKHRFNNFLMEFKPPASLDTKDVKKWVIRAFWPEFWWRYLWELEKPGDSAVWARTEEWLKRLVQYGGALRELWGLPSAELNSAFRYLASRDGVAVDNVDPALAIYLAVTPPWEPPQRAKQQEFIPPVPSMREAESSDLLARTLPTAPKDEATGVTEPPELEILSNYVIADRAEDEGDVDDVRRRLQRIMQIAQDPSISDVAGPTVGNAALMAERINWIEAALWLHRRGLEISPGHHNMMQNYLEFILDNHGNLPDWLPEAEGLQTAEKLLATLETSGAAHKPLRTRILALRLAAISGKPDEGISNGVRKLISDMGADINLSRLRSVFAFSPRYITLHEAAEVAKAYIQAGGSDYDRYAGLRLLADEAATSGDSDAVNMAADINRFLLSSGLACLPEGDDSAEVKHNLATLLFALDYDRTATLLWEEAYNALPHDLRIRRALGIALNNLELRTEAAAVLSGQTILPLKLDPDRVPARFWTGDHWWESLPRDHQAQPCRTQAFGEDVP